MAEEFTESLKKALDHLSEGIQQQKMAENAPWILEMFEKHTPERLSKLSTFDVYVNSKRADRSNVLFNSLYQGGFIPNAVNPSDKSKAEFVYSKYAYLKRQLGVFISEVNGFSCSQDKVSFILNAYLSTLAGKPVDWNVDKYWTPNAGSLEQWNELIESLRDLFYATDYGERRLNAINAIRAEYKVVNEK